MPRRDRHRIGWAPLACDGLLFDTEAMITHQLAMLVAYTLFSACLLVMAAPQMRL
jgi:hypothetical protein